MREIVKLDSSWEVRHREFLKRGILEHPNSFRMTVADLLEGRVSFISERPDDFTLASLSEKGDLIGVVSFSRYRLEKMLHKGRIFGMYVAKEASGRGVGRELLQTCLKCARQITNLSQVDLEYVASNDPARRLYESEGFVAFSLEHDATKIEEVTQDEVRMALKLRDLP